MLALIGQMSVGETLLIAIVAVIVFGRNLPQVAGRVYGQVRKMRRALDDLRRESGIDREMHSMKGELRDVGRAADIQADLREARASAPTYPDPTPEALDPGTGELRPRREDEPPPEETREAASDDEEEESRDDDEARPA